MINIKHKIKNKDSVHTLLAKAKFKGVWLCPSSLTKTFSCMVVVGCLVALLYACTSIECPMNSYVASNYAFYSTDGQPVSLADTLTVSSNRRDGSDTILINRQTGAHQLRLPMSYNAATDTLLFTVADTSHHRISDYVFISKTNDMHFESVDCGATFFHEITSASSTHNFIDTVVVLTKSVNYDSSPIHIQIIVR